MRVHTYSIAVGLTVLFTGFAQAQSTGHTTEASDLRLNVTNALVTSLKSSRHFTLDLKWDFLPPATHVKEMKRIFDMSWRDTKNVLWGEWTISNEDISEGVPLSRIIGRDPDSLKFFSAVINSGNSFEITEETDVAATLAESLSTIQNRIGDLKPWQRVDDWPMPGGPINDDVPYPQLANYRFCLSMLRSLIVSKGMGVKLEERTGALNISGPKYLHDEIVWTIRAYRSGFYGFSGESSVPQTYTLSIEANVRNVKFDMIAAGNTSKNIQIDMTAGLLQEVNIPGLERSGGIKSLAMMPWTVATGSTEVNKSNVEEFEGSKSLRKTEVSPSSSSMLLNIVGGVDAGSSLFDAILTSRDDARVFTGGLIGNGETQRVLGVNMLIPRSSVGILFGLVPDNSNALFIGPSVTTGIFTLGAGARIFGRDDGTTAAKFAGVVSLDLARIFSSPTRPTSIDFRPQDSSSSFWKAFPVASANQIVATFSFMMAGGFEPGTTLSIIQINQDDTKITGGKEITFTWENEPSNIWSLSTLLPLGRYRLQLPQGVIVSDYIGDDEFEQREFGETVILDMTTGGTRHFNLKLSKG